MPPDYERLQNSRDDVADTVEWASKWIEILEEDARSRRSDLGILQADAERLGAIAHSILPGRVRETGSGRRWYLSEGSRRGDALAEIKRATEMSEYAAERAAKAVGKRRQDKRFELTD